MIDNQSVNNASDDEIRSVEQATLPSFLQPLPLTPPSPPVEIDGNQQLLAGITIIIDQLALILFIIQNNDR